MSGLHNISSSGLQLTKGEMHRGLAAINADNSSLGNKIWTGKAIAGETTKIARTLLLLYTWYGNDFYKLRDFILTY